MSDVLHTIRAALPGETPDIRCLFLAGYLGSCKAIPCTLPVFDQAANAFMTVTKLEWATWEAVLASLIQLSFAKPDDIVAFRNYLGKEVDAYKASLPKASPAGPVVEVPLLVVLSPADIELANSFRSHKKQLPGLSIGEDEKPAYVLSFWPVPSPDPGVKLELRGQNAEGGPVLVVVATDPAGATIGSSKPARDIAIEHRIELGGKVYVVKIGAGSA